MAANATTEGERRVLAEAPAGWTVDLSDLSYRERIVSADVISSLCVTPSPKAVHRRGITIKGARIVEPLDLSFYTVPHPLRFVLTTFDAVPDLHEAQLPALVFLDCSLPGLEATGIRVRDLGLVSSTVSGEVSLMGATIGQLVCLNTTITNKDGIAISAEGAEMTGGAYLEGLNATRSVRLVNAVIGGPLNCSRAMVRNVDGVALCADLAEIKGGVSLDSEAGERFTATGTVRLLGARIGGNLDCSGATLIDKEGGNALIVDGAEIAGDVFLREGFSATGTVRIHAAKIGGQLDCSNATVTNKGGRSLSAEQAEINGSVFLRNLWAVGTVSLLGAKIGGPLDCSDAVFVQRDAYVALAARDAILGIGLVFRNVHATSGVDLFGARAATLNDDLGKPDKPSLGSWDGVKPLILDGFVYTRFGHDTESSSKARTCWLKQTRGLQDGNGFQHGAWQQLINVYRGQGRDDEVTRAAIAMHRDRVKRAGLPRYRRWGRHLLGAFVGHGYRSWYTGVWAVAIMIGFGYLVGHCSGMFVPAKQGVTGHPSGYPERAAYAVDAFLPIVDLGQEDRWMPTGWIRWVDWLVILLGWSLTTLFVAGFTKIVRIE